MRATATRTLQAPQYAPITMTLEEECTPETFSATLNKLADLIENTLRERYPQYAGVLPKVEKKAEVIPNSYHTPGLLLKGSPSEAFHMNNKLKEDKVINIQRGAALVECIKNCTSLSELQGYYRDLDSDEAANAYDEKKRQFQHKKVS